MASVSFVECPTYRMCMYSPAKHSGDSFVKGDPETFIGLVFEISLGSFSVRASIFCRFRGSRVKARDAGTGSGTTVPRRTAACHCTCTTHRSHRSPTWECQKAEFRKVGLATSPRSASARV